MIYIGGLYHSDKPAIVKWLKWYIELHIYDSVDWWSEFLIGKDKTHKVYF